MVKGNGSTWNEKKCFLRASTFTLEIFHVTPPRFGAFIYEKRRDENENNKITQKSSV